MKPLLLAGCLLPVLCAAQTRGPVIAEDYLRLIRKDSNQIRWSDSTNNLKTAWLRGEPFNLYNYQSVRKIITGKNNRLRIIPGFEKTLYTGGSYSQTIEWQQRNRIPALQREFSQGRPGGGQYQWRGPETHELFSYGPALSGLVYDGTAYAWDVNGRLVTAGSNNSPRANSYTNSVFRNGIQFNNNINVYAKLKSAHNKFLNLTLSAGQVSNKTILRKNSVFSDQLSFLFNGQNKRFIFSSSWSRREEQDDYSNRDGFLQRVYLYSLLSPVSFSAEQGLRLPGGQRSYSAEADNPFFLLDNPARGLRRVQETRSLGVEFTPGRFRVRLNQSWEQDTERSQEYREAGTAGFPAGLQAERNFSYRVYSLNSQLNFSVPFTDYKFRADAVLNYILTDSRSRIAYPFQQLFYAYHRLSQEARISFHPSVRLNTFEAGLELAGKFRHSGTSTTNLNLMPSVSLYNWIYNPFDWSWMDIKITGSYNRFDSEISLDQSFAGTALLLTDPDQFNTYLPLQEAGSFAGLKPLQHREYQASAAWYLFRRVVQLSYSWYRRSVKEDIFPLRQGGEWQLVNLASHVTRGTEIMLELHPWQYKRQQLKPGLIASFFRYRSKVTGIKEGYNHLPLAGFRSIHKALVKGEAPGVIRGSGWLRNTAGNVIIGQDGFPLADTALKTIGNPLPDFVIKFSPRLQFRSFDFSMDWEWKKGGQIWNGTAAVLNYYGRSAETARQRSYTGYLFNGVLSDGTHNTLPVSFSDPSRPIEENRWVRYGLSGVAEEYIQPADILSIRQVSLTWKHAFKKTLKQFTAGIYAANLLVWTPYKGADPGQLLLDKPGTEGLDFFNLPSARSAGFTLTLQF